MNAEYVWWIVALVLVGGGGVAFLALGRIPEIGEAREEPDAPGVGVAGAAASTPGVEQAQSRPVRTTVPGPDEAASTSETP